MAEVSTEDQRVLDWLEDGSHATKPPETSTPPRSGNPSPARRAAQERKREWIATRWRYQVLARLGRRREQARFVALVEEFLDGTETEIPDWIAESVTRIVEHDNRQPRDTPPGIPPKQLYQQLAEAYHREQA